MKKIEDIKERTIENMLEHYAYVSKEKWPIITYKTRELLSEEIKRRLSIQYQKWAEAQSKNYKK